jgi:hypothetical protein
MYLMQNKLAMLIRNSHEINNLTFLTVVSSVLHFVLTRPVKLKTKCQHIQEKEENKCFFFLYYLIYLFIYFFLFYKPTIYKVLK